MSRKRKKGDGTIRKRSDGRWEGRVVIGYDDNGLPKTKNVLAKTKRECQEKLKTLAESMVGRDDRKIKPDMLFGDWLCYWYENHSKPMLRVSTQNNYENVIHNHVLPEIGKIPLNKLTQNNLQQFYGRLKRTGRGKALNKAVLWLSQFRFTERRGLSRSSKIPVEYRAIRQAIVPCSLSFTVL